MPLRRALLFVVLSLVSACALCQSTTWRVSASALFGQEWLGSEDTRRGSMYSLSFAHPEPRFHTWGYNAELDIEAYYMFTKGGARFVAGPNSSHHYGVMLIDRYFQHRSGEVRTFLEGGWGVQYTNRLTHDIDSMWNSTPMIGAGLVMPLQGKELMFTVRYFHISNAGTQGGNEGLNFFQVLVGVRF